MFGHWKQAIGQRFLDALFLLDGQASGEDELETEAEVALLARIPGEGHALSMHDFFVARIYDVRTWDT